nr:uncharacterized protein LOC129267366 [Lytechinus pictus]
MGPRLTNFSSFPFVVGSSRKAEFISSPPQDRRRTLPPTPPGHPPLPDRSTSLQQRQVPSAPPNIPMRSMVPVSEDTVRGSGEELVESRMNGESDIGTDYDLLNHGSPWAVPHVYRETTNGLAEYAQVSRPNTNKQMTQSRHQPKEVI